MSVLLSFGEETFHGEILATGEPDQIVADLRGAERAVIVVPFDPREASVAHRVAPTPQPVALPRLGLRARTHQVVEEPSAATYAIRVADALERIERGDLDKVVLGRGLRITSTPAWSPEELLARVLDARPGRYVFSVPTAHGTLIGASPELLVRRRGSQVHSLPLAGSAPRSSDRAQDAAASAALLASAKDLDEHRFVVDDIVAALSQVADITRAARTPELLSTDALWHLATPIEARLRTEVSALDLVRVLHPTPAMAGVPTAAALAAIAEIERTSRGPLTGAVGWVDANGDGEFALTIRAGVLSGDTFGLFAGAGIVAGSVPADEAAETGAKLSTMLRIAGVEDDSACPAHLAHPDHPAHPDQRSQDGQEGAA